MARSCIKWFIYTLCSPFIAVIFCIAAILFLAICAFFVVAVIAIGVYFVIGFICINIYFSCFMGIFHIKRSFRWMMRKLKM